ncbi:MAG TPA: O-antigen ligase family protein [Candidatus Baltobacteraceae bacterium]|nr:O-antigen ligase family protein [Candidatus Baltobacteraceae bacterium]
MQFALWRDRLVLLILALLPWQARYIKEPAALLGAPWEQGTASLFALEVLVLVALGLHLLATASRCEPKKSGAPIWLQLSALMPIYAFISVFWAYDTVGALFSAIHLFEGYALTYLIWASGVRLTPALAAFTLGVASTSALGVWQSLTQSSFGSSWLGISAHPLQEAGVSVVETASGRYLRAYGTLPHPNVLGGYAAAGLVAALALASQAGKGRRLLLALTGLIAAGLVAALSRSAWLAAFAAVGIALAVPRAVDKSVRFRLRPALACAALCAALIAVLSAPVITARLTGQGRLETKSIEERTSSLADGTELLKRNVALGAGVGNYLPTAFLELGFPDDPYAVQPPHFTPLLVGVELGFFGLAILLGFVVAWWFDAIWLMRRARSPMVAIAAALPVVIIVVASFDHYPYDIFAGTMLTGALFGLFLKAGEESGG